MGTSRVVAYTVTSGNREKSPKKVYKTRVARGMWQQKGRISAALSMNPAEDLVFPPQPSVWEAGKEDPRPTKGRCWRTHRVCELLGPTLVMLR